MNPHVQAVVAAAKAMIDYPYEMGGRGQPPDYGIDCRGFVQRAFRIGGAADLIGDGQPNVRHMVAWAKANGRFRDPTFVGERGDVIFYNEPSAMPGPPTNPDCIRHVALFLQPVSKRWPKGRAISALNPALDVRYHALALHGLAIYGYCEPDWAALDVPEPPIIDPEPPITPMPGDIE